VKLKFRFSGRFWHLALTHRVWFLPRCISVCYAGWYYIRGQHVRLFVCQTRELWKKRNKLLPKFLQRIKGLFGDAENAGVENAGVEIAAPKCRGGNRGSRKSMESEGFKNVSLTILTENRVMILAAEQVSFANIGNKEHMTEKQHTMR